MDLMFYMGILLGFALGYLVVSFTCEAKYKYKIRVKELELEEMKLSQQYLKEIGGNQCK